ncbi:MAG: 6-bladed beta-propeller [Armatimonadetes bacterium]|nr:6-bladed beta-propeller [Armatimonadota bacterium]
MSSKPTAVAVDYLNNVYIACPNRILVFDSKGKFRKVIGNTGIGPGQFTAITDIWVDTAQRIYVTDAQSLGVQILSPKGKLLLGFGTHNAGVTNFSLPTAICTDRRGDIWVVDTLRQIISAFRRHGDQVEYLDSMGGFGVQPGEVAFPSAIGADWNGRLIIVDRVGGRVQCFDWK